MLVDKQVKPAMRGQAQALLSTLTGIGALLGSLFCGWYFRMVMNSSGDWVVFWGGLSAAVLLCMLYFVRCYRNTGIEKSS
jgi:hypothetical protein